MTGVFGPLRRSAAAFRIAGKQLRKNPRKSLLIVTLVALPSMVMMMIGTVFASQNPTASEFINSELGATQARISLGAPDGVTVMQDSITGEYGGSFTPYAANAPFADVSSLLPSGARVLTLDYSNGAVVDTGERVVRLGGTVGEAWDEAFKGKFHVVEGATPTGPGQIMLSPDAAKRLGVAVGARVAIGRPAHDVTIVGILGGSGAYWSGMVYALPADLEAVDDSTARTWFVTGVSISAEQQAGLNTHGLIVVSRDVIESGRSDGPVGSGLGALAQAAGNTGISTSAGVGSFEMLLLAGAGFVVSMRSNQRSLALLGATGAARGTLVGVGVGTGVWLGLLGGLAGVPFGVGLGWAWVWFQLHHAGPWGAASVWGYHVAWEHAAGVVLFAVVVGALSSLVPAVMAARVDVVASLRGSRRPARPRAWPTIVGVALVAVAVALFAVAARLHAHSWAIAPDLANAERSRATSFTIVAVVVGLAGASFAAPLALRILARALAPLGVAARIAARDAARQAGRTVPVVAAIAITVVAATLGGITAAHEAQLQRGQIAHEMPYGDGSVRLDQGTEGHTDYVDAAGIQAAVNEVAPDAHAVGVNALQDQNSDPQGRLVVTLAMPAPNICPQNLPGGGAMTELEVAADSRCGRDGDVGIFASGIVVGGPEQLGILLGREPTSTELAMLADGGVVVLSPQYVNGNSATFDVWDYTSGDTPGIPESGDLPVPSRSVSLHAVVALPVGSHQSGFTSVISTATAAGLGATVVPSRVLVHRDGGLSADQQAEIQSALLRVGDVWLSVEEPPADYALQYALISLGGVLLMAGACTAVAIGLARQEAAHDDATLTSLGASPSLTKRVAAWQAGITVGLASWIGVALGIGVAWVGMRDVATGRLEAPWLQLITLLVVVPAVVAGLAWVFTRAPKVIHFRLVA